MAETKTKTAAKPATKAATKTATTVKMIRIQYYRSKNSTPAKHKAGREGPGLYAPQPDRRARRHRFHPRHGKGHSASGSDRRELVRSAHSVSKLLTHCRHC